MKQNIIMIIILIALFFFGLLIYDFSDELDKKITDYNWYSLEENKTVVVSFKDNKFAYYYEDTALPYGDYKNCQSYKYNRSINVVKLDCAVKGNKLYIASNEDNKLTFTIDGAEKTFYKSLQEAINAQFIIENEITEEQFNELMNYNLNNFQIINYDNINSLYKNKTTEYIAILNKEETIKNALNINALNNIKDEYNDSLSALIINDLSSSELNKLNKLTNEIPTNIEEYNNNKILIFKVGDKKITLVKTIECEKYSDIAKETE